jgi:acyl dehydratase
MRGIVPMTDILSRILVGAKFKSRGRTLSDGEFALLTTLTWTNTEIHSNAEFAKRTQFGERILSGPLVATLIVGLAVTSDFYRTLEESGVRLLALLGMEKVRFLAPVQPNDTLWAETEIVAARLTSRPGRGVPTWVDRGINQRDEIISEATLKGLFELR